MFGPVLCKLLIAFNYLLDVIIPVVLPTRYGKVKSWKLLQFKLGVQNMFATMGSEFNFEDALLDKFEPFVWKVQMRQYIGISAKAKRKLRINRTCHLQEMSFSSTASGQLLLQPLQNKHLKKDWKFLINHVGHR